MDEKMDIIQETELDEVSGGAGSAKKHVQIVNCKHSCNVRSTPDSKSDKNLIGHANLGDRYVFYGWSGSWAKVQYGSAVGYIHQDFIKVL